MKKEKAENPEESKNSFKYYIMTNTEFQSKVQQWLFERGNVKIGNWSIELGQESARIIVEIKINGKMMVADSITRDDDEAIQNAVLALNEELKKKLNAETDNVI